MQVDLGARGVFHAIELGDKAAPVAVWLHGFPDHPPTAVPMLEHLTRRRRVIAPWLRGYAPSPVDGPRGAFELDALVDDVLAIIDRVAPGAPVDLIGHDWGAVITYALCARAGDRVRRAVTLAVPHPLTFLRALQSAPQMRRSWYIALFQIPGAERVVRANDLALIDHLWQTWSPGWRLDPARRAALHACLAASLPAPLHYYRAILRPFVTLRRRLERLAAPIATPVLQLHGAEDGCVMAPDDRDARRFSHRVLEVLPNVGHFLHLEQPTEIARRIEAWLA